MLKSHALALFLVISAATAVHAQQPSPSETTSAQQPAIGDKRGTKDAPLAIEITNPPSGSEIASELKRNRDDQAAESRRSLIFNSLIIGVGFLQCGVLLFTVFVTNKAANVAKRAAEALPNVERAYVFVRDIILPPDKPLPAGTGDASDYYISVRFDNVGKTPAIPRTFQFGVFADNDVPPSKKVLKGLQHDTLQRRVVPAGAPLTHSARVNIRGDWKPRPVTVRPANRVFMVGFLKYVDIFDGQHETCFCWELDWDGKAFREALAPDLNYER